MGSKQEQALILDPSTELRFKGTMRTTAPPTATDDLCYFRSF